MSRYSDLDITFTKSAEDEHSYCLSFRFKGAGDDAEQRSPTDPIVTLDSFALAGDDPQAYADALTAAFFTPRVRAEFNRFRAAALRDSILRVRLSIDAQAPELHAIHWEMLRDPDPPARADRAHLFTGEQTLVFRFLSSSDSRQIQLPAKGALRALAVVANPASSPSYALDPIDVPAQIALATQSMSGIQVTPFAPGGAVSLNALATKLREGFDILYLVCHGRVVDQLPYLYLNEGQPDPGLDLVHAIRDLERRPRLVVLASCQSAGKDGIGLAALGPLLAEAGVPAVVAMQGNISMSTAAAFTHRFFSELVRDGQIDRAMAVARGEVRKADDYWMPVLFMRLRDGRIWHEPGLDNGSPATNQRKVAPIIYLPQRKALFIGREPEIESLRQQLQEPGSLAYISGVAGRGKTSLALEYAHRHKADFESVHWLSCHQRSLVQIAGELAFQLGLKPEGDFDTIVHELNGHCAQKRCLLVLDNVDDETPARLLPGGHTSVLITTRFNNLRFLRHYQPVNLPLFSQEQCFELFRRDIGKEEVDRHAADAGLLFQRLGYLPIGISAAAGLVREDVRYTIQAMAKNLPADAYALLREAVAALTPGAQTLLMAMAVCAPEGFRLSLAAEIAELDEETSLNALQEIHSRSLDEELDRSARRYRLHALVREAAGAIDAQRRKHAHAIRKEFDNWETDWQSCERDMADWQAAFSWLLSQAEDEAWGTVKDLAYGGVRLTHRLGRLSEAHEICERMVQKAHTRNDARTLQTWYGYQAIMLRDRGRYEEAMALREKEKVIGLELGDKNGLQRCYGNQALILRDWGRREEALALHKEEEAICLELGNQDSLQRSYGNQALILTDCKRLEEAMTLCKMQEAICVEQNNQHDLALSYGNQANILQTWGKLEEAMALHQKDEAICLGLGNKDGLQRSYGNQAIILRNWGRLDEALVLYKKQEAICSKLGSKRGLAYCYWNWGLLERKQANRRSERQKLEHSLALFVELKMPLEIKGVQAELDKTNAADPAT